MNQWHQRNGMHLKDAGKIGQRLKVFRLNEPIHDQAMCALSANYFVWNHDVARFFGAEVPDDF
jgi:hypothetical protein